MFFYPIMLTSAEMNCIYCIFFSMSPFSSVMYTHTFWLVWLGQQREREREKALLLTLLYVVEIVGKGDPKWMKQLLLLFQASLFHHNDVWTYLTKLTSWHRLRSFYMAKKYIEEHDFFWPDLHIIYSHCLKDHYPHYSSNL